MKYKILALVTVCIIFVNCRNKYNTNIQNESESETRMYGLDIENDSCKVKITRVDKKDFANFKNEVIKSSINFQKKSILEMNAECISLRELLAAIKEIDVKYIILNNDLEREYYSVLINNKLSSEKQDSISKRKIIEALKINIEKSIFNIDTLMISMNDKAKYLKFENPVKKLNRNSITSQSKITADSMIFYNYELGGILTVLRNEFNKPLFLGTTEPPRINYMLKRTTWEATKAKLESDLGIAFNIKITQEEKYLVTRKNKD